MDHPAELAPVQPWRAAAIVAAAIAAVELFVLILVGIVFGARLAANHADQTVTSARTEARVAAAPAKTETGKAAPAKGQSASEATLPRNKTSVMVLNGNGISGAAGTVAERVQGLRYIVTGTGNAPRSDFQRSIVMYRPGLEAEARRLANDLHTRRVAPLDGIRRSDLQGAQLALIIGG